MNTKHHNYLPVKFSRLGFIILILIHLFFIYHIGYFLSPEFILYPYLTSIGLKPYLNIIDQHLPIIFFGAISLPRIFTVNMQTIFTLFLFLITVTDLLFFYLLRPLTTFNRYTIFIFFLIATFLFSGTTLWLETFVVPIIIILLLLKTEGFSQFFLGFLTALAILIRPILAPTIFLILIYRQVKFSRYLLAGFLVPLLFTLSHLNYQQLFSSFFEVFFKFNSHDYSQLATKLPSKQQLILISLLFLPVLIRLLKNKKFLSVGILLLSFLPVWPRFELIHLQPALILAIYFYSIDIHRHSHFSKIIIIVFLALFLKKILISKTYGNFYLTPEIQTVSNFVHALSSPQLFVLGGSDLIYSLSGKIPAGDYYLPSLPWYYQNSDFVSRQIQALDSNPEAIVVINTTSAIDNLPLKLFAHPVFHHILQKYTKIQTIGSYQIYKIKQ